MYFTISYTFFAGNYLPIIINYSASYITSEDTFQVRRCLCNFLLCFVYISELSNLHAQRNLQAEAGKDPAAQRIPGC